MIEVPNSYQNQLREFGTANARGGNASLIMGAADEMDEMDRLICCLLDANERGRGVQFDEALRALADLVEYDRRKE